MLDALGLRFRDAGLEQCYASESGLHTFSTVDQQLTRFHMIVVAANLLEQWLWPNDDVRAHTATPLGFITCLLWLLVGHLRRSTVKSDEWTWLRRAVFIFLLTLFSPLVLATCHPYWYGDPVTDEVMLSRFLLLRCGAIIMVAFAMYTPLMVRHQILVQAAALTAITLFSTPHNCDVAVQAPEAQDLFLRFWVSLDGLARRLMNGVYLLVPVSHVRPPPGTACQHAATWCLLVMGFVLPMCALWWREHLSRVRFVKSKRPEKVQSENQLYWERVTLFKAVCYAPPFIMFLAVSWLYLLKMYGEGSAKGLVSAR